MRNARSNSITFLFLIGMLFVGIAVAKDCPYTTCMTEADGSQTCVTVPCPTKPTTPTTPTNPTKPAMPTKPTTPPVKPAPRKGSEPAK